MDEDKYNNGKSFQEMIDDGEMTEEEIEDVLFQDTNPNSVDTSLLNDFLRKHKIQK